MTMPEKLKSRKFWVAMMAISVATGLLIAGLITNEQWMQIFGLTVGSYLVSQGIADHGVSG